MSTSALAAADVMPDVFGVMADFFKQTTATGFSGPITAETALLSSGLLDSLSMLQLTTHLSDTFGIEFEDDDFTAENFATAGGLAELVLLKISRGG